MRHPSTRAVQLLAWLRTQPVLSSERGSFEGRREQAHSTGQNVSVARILLGVTGGIASYKACELVRMFVRAGHEVIPLVSPGAERFVTAETFEALARRPAGESPYPHLETADLLVVAPLTANTLAKLAHGLAELAHGGPVVRAPAMNDRMWTQPATQATVELVGARGAELVGPATGELAEGGEGVGRMAEPREIFERCLALLGNGSLAGRRVVVSAGGRCASSATAPPAGWASPGPPRRPGGGPT